MISSAFALKVFIRKKNLPHQKTGTCILAAERQNFPPVWFFFKKSSFMHQLILLRHAKSDGISDGGSDFMRPLAPQGQEELPDIAIALRPYLEGGICCLCSSALRTRQTFDVASKYWPEITPIFMDSLYEFGASAIEKEIDKVAETADTIMVIGHNPGLSQILQRLQPASPSHMPTSCAAILQHSDTEPASGMQLAGFYTPESIAQGRGHSAEYKGIT